MNGDGLSGVGIRLFLGKGGVGKTTCASAMTSHVHAFDPYRFPIYWRSARSNVQ